MLWFSLLCEDEWRHQHWEPVCNVYSLYTTCSKGHLHFPLMSEAAFSYAAFGNLTCSFQGLMSNVFTSFAELSSQESVSAVTQRLHNWQENQLQPNWNISMCFFHILTPSRSTDIYTHCWITGCGQGDPFNPSIRNMQTLWFDGVTPNMYGQCAWSCLEFPNLQM